MLLKHEPKNLNVYSIRVRSECFINLGLTQLTCTECDPFDPSDSTRFQAAWGICILVGAIISAVHKS